MDIELLKKLTSAHSVSGCEKAISDVIRDECEPYADEITTDNLGNLYVHKKGDGKKIMMSAHMDSIGMIVTYIDDDGYLRFSNLGGLRLSCLPSMRVRFKNGAVGVVELAGGVKASEARVTDMYIDIGVSSREEALELVQVGDTAVYDAPCEAIGKYYVSPYMDNRIGCYVLIETLRKLNQPENDCWFVFSVQEEVGMRGAKPAAYNVDPELAIAVDVAGVADTPDCEVKSDTSLGKGAIIKLMDGSVICHSSVVKLLEDAAAKAGAASQLDARQMGGTDAGAIHISRGGIPSGILSIPTRYIHTPSEMVDQRDVEACIETLYQAIK